MLNVASPAEITEAVEASFAGCADDRLRAVLQGLVRHLHAFAMDVELTEAEWRTAIDADSPYLDSDTVFAVKPSLLRRFVPRASDDPEKPPAATGPWWSVENDILLAPAANALRPPR
jgi:hypothetical protein